MEKNKLEDLSVKLKELALFWMYEGLKAGYSGALACVNRGVKLESPSFYMNAIKDNPAIVDSVSKIVESFLRVEGNENNIVNLFLDEQTK